MPLYVEHPVDGKESIAQGNFGENYGKKKKKKCLTNPSVMAEN